MAEAAQLQADLEQYAESKIADGGDPYEVYMHATAQAMGAWRLAQLLRLPGQGDYKGVHTTKACIQRFRTRLSTFSKQQEDRETAISVLSNRREYERQQRH